MAAKEYKITLPGKAPVKIWANSAEQAARRAERDNGTGHVVTQKRFVANVTRKQAVPPLDYFDEEREFGRVYGEEEA